MLESVVVTEQHQMRNERRVCFVLGSPRLPCGRRAKNSFEESGWNKAPAVSGGKDECQVRLQGRERDYWMGTEIRMLGGYGFQGQVTAGDGSDKKGKMGAGYNNLRRKKKKQQCKVGREEEGSSSNQSELAAFSLALRDTPRPIEELLLYLCDNQSLLKAVNRWIVEGGVWAPDADILTAAIEIQRKRIAAGTATFLVKVKAHGGESAKERTFWRIRLF